MKCPRCKSDFFPWYRCCATDGNDHKRLLIRVGLLENNMTPKEIDKVVCDWSLEFGIAMPERALNALVDRLATISGLPGLDPHDSSS